MNKTLLSLPIILLISMSCTLSSEDLPACEALTQVDRQMLDLVETIEEEYHLDKEFISAFKNSQIYWTQYRNRQVKAVYPLSPRKYDFDIGPCKCELMTELTQARIEELKKWTEGVYSSECLGTFKQKRN